MNARKQILNMLAEGTISVDEASELLEALEASNEAGGEERKKTSQVKKLRISFDGERKNGEPAKIDLELPIAMAKFADKFIDKYKMPVMEREGINLKEVFETFKEDDLERGVILDLESDRKNDGSKTKIKIEVI